MTGSHGGWRHYEVSSWHIACRCGPRPDTGTHSDGDEEIYLTHNVGNCLEVWKSTGTQGLRLQIMMDSSNDKSYTCWLYLMGDILIFNIQWLKYLGSLSATVWAREILNLSGLSILSNPFKFQVLKNLCPIFVSNNSVPVIGLNMNPAETRDNQWSPEEDNWWSGTKMVIFDQFFWNHNGGPHSELSLRSCHWRWPGCCWKSQWRKTTRDVLRSTGLKEQKTPYFRKPLL